MRKEPNLWHKIHPVTLIAPWLRFLLRRFHIANSWPPPQRPLRWSKQRITWLRPCNRLRLSTPLLSRS